MPARADWVLRPGTQKNVDLQAPQVIASVSAGANTSSSDGPYEVVGTGISRAQVTFDWKPGAGIIDRPFRINHFLTVTDSLSTSVTPGMGGNAVAEAHIFVNGYDYFEKRTLSGYAELPLESSPSLVGMKQYKDYPLLRGADGTYPAITPTFDSSLSAWVKANSSGYRTGTTTGGTMNSAKATVSASSIKTTSFSVEYQ